MTASSDKSLFAFGSLTIEFFRMTLLSLHPSLDLPELAFASEQLLSLFVDLSLNLDLDFAELLFFAAQLFFLEANGLIGKIFGLDG